MTNKELEFHRELVYAIGLNKILRKYAENTVDGDVALMAQIDAVGDKLCAIDRSLDKAEKE